MEFSVVTSMMDPGHLSIRLNADDRSGRHFKEALRGAGFKAGDRVVMTLVTETQRRTLDVRTFTRKPAAHVLDSRGRIKLHKFEPPHDDPTPGPCWYCLKPEEHWTHRKHQGQAKRREG